MESMGTKGRKFLSILHPNTNFIPNSDLTPTPSIVLALTLTQTLTLTITLTLR